MREVLHRLAVQVEAAIDRVRPPRRREPTFDAHRGYATPELLVVRGRTVESPRRALTSTAKSRWHTVRSMAALFATSEIPAVTVSCRGLEARSDDEGYVTMCVPRPPGLEPGWHREVVQVAGGLPVEVPILVPDPAATRIVISDIDDTVIQTGSASSLGAIWTTLNGSVDSRLVFPDAIELLTTLHDGGKTPLFYLSSSPWNLHHFLGTLFERRGVPIGPMFLRDFGISDRQFIMGTHDDHKSKAIDTILEAVPDLPVTLIGDTVEHDARIYANAVGRWPGRIEGVMLRQPHARLRSPAREGLARLRATPVRLHVGEDFRAAIEAYGA